MSAKLTVVEPTEPPEDDFEALLEDAAKAMLKIATDHQVEPVERVKAFDAASKWAQSRAKANPKTQRPAFLDLRDKVGGKK